MLFFYGYFEYLSLLYVLVSSFGNFLILGLIERVKINVNLCYNSCD